MDDQQTRDARRTPKLSCDQVIAFRLERQLLRSRAPAGSLFEVASALCGVRAQLPLTAELALWARVDGLAQGEVKHALEDERTLVKTWIRNTLNVVPADDFALYVAVQRPRPEGAGRCLASSSGGDAGAVRGDREERSARARRAAANA